jgi:hypothetical protein
LVGVDDDPQFHTVAGGQNDREIAAVGEVDVTGDDTLNGVRTIPQDGRPYVEPFRSEVPFFE